jgi:hypothetical protein
LPKAKSTRIAQTYHNQRLTEVSLPSEAELQCSCVEAGPGYVGRYDSGGDGHSLLVLVDAVLAADSWTLRRLRGQVDTGVDMRHATLSGGQPHPQSDLEPAPR